MLEDDNSIIPVSHLFSNDVTKSDHELSKELEVRRLQD